MSGLTLRKRRHGGDEEITDKLDLFKEPPISSQIEGGRWTFHRAADLNPHGSEIKINVSRSDEEFTDLSETFLVLEYKIEGINGAALNADAANINVYQGDHGDLLFNSAQLRINNTTVEYMSNYGITGYLQTLLSHTTSAKKTRLSSEGWFEDDARGANLPADNAAVVPRKQKLINSNKQVLVLRPKFSLCQQRRLFIPGTEFEFLFRRSPKESFLTGTDDAVAAVRINIISAEMRVRRYNVDNQVYTALLTAASGTSANDTTKEPVTFAYPSKVLSTSEFTIGNGTTSHTISIPSIQKPDKVLVVFVNQGAHTGTAEAKPNHFQHLSISQAELKFDGVPVDQEITCDFRPGGSSDRSYASLFEIAFRRAKHDSNGVTQTEFRTNSTIFAWNTQDLLGSNVNKKKTIGLSLSFRMREATDNVYTAIVIRESTLITHIGLDGTALKG